MTDLRFYNSLSKKVEVFKARDGKKVRIYNCGPTVYKRQHIGNMRRFLFADFLHRTLEYFGYEVNEVMNITDVGHLTEDEIDEGEDKVEKVAREMRMTPQEIAKDQIKLFKQDINDLNIMPATKYPKASEHIEQMQKMISALIGRGHAYQTNSGVYFDVQSFAAYGKLSGNTLKDIAAGSRVEVRKEKRHPADFALWVVDDKHIQKWDSPWGKGYPGWHIECSAMSREYLGDDIDIHTGGEDNRFPHHENEIAQSEGSCGERFVNMWMHNRHLRMGGKKLAKRQGEQITLDTIRERGYSPLAFRLLVFGSHYRSRIDFAWDAMDAAQENLESIKQLLRQLHVTAPVASRTPEAAEVKIDEPVNEISEFESALADDLNTPEALAAFLQYVKKSNTILADSPPPAQKTTILSHLKEMDEILGIIGPLMSELEAVTLPADIQKLVDQREQARTDCDFKEADRLRKEILGNGYRLEDDAESGPRIIKI